MNDCDSDSANAKTSIGMAKECVLDARHCSCVMEMQWTRLTYDAFPVSIALRKCHGMVRGR